MSLICLFRFWQKVAKVKRGNHQIPILGGSAPAEVEELAMATGVYLRPLGSQAKPTRMPHA